MRAFGWRDGVEVFCGWSYFDTQAGEGVEGFQDVVIEVRGEFVEFVEKPGLGYGWVLQVGEREFADQEEPVGVAGPFDVEVVVEVEGGVDVAADEFVGYGPVVDAIYGDFVGVEFVAFFRYVADVYGSDSALAFGEEEIG